jgi:hypothetical protein
MNPNTLAMIGALQARNEINNLKHTAREFGLAGAVGVLGLGLVADHIWARRRFKKQQNQISEQTKELRQTNEALQREQAANTVARHKLERVSASQSGESQQLGDRLHGHHETKVEAGVAAGLAAAIIPGG